MRTVILVVIAAFMLTACNEPDGKPEPTESIAEAMKDTEEQHAEKHKDIKYVCPMHPEIVSNEAGNCSICGMFLEKQEVQSESEETTASESSN